MDKITCKCGNSKRPKNNTCGICDAPPLLGDFRNADCMECGKFIACLNVMATMLSHWPRYCSTECTLAGEEAALKMISKYRKSK